MNIAIICALIIHYIMTINQFLSINHIFYWLIIAIFVNNVIWLKKIDYNSIIQNLVVFLVINFAIYISLFSYFNGDVGALTSRAILRNVVSIGLIFYIHKIPRLSKIFSAKEYGYRLVASIAAMVVNVFLLSNTSLPGQLIFFLILLYIGLAGMLTFYAAKYVQKRIL